jgi:uncharacterized protein
MPYLIDGHNLIGQIHRSLLAEPEDERLLLERLAPLARRLRRKMTVFFDGGDPAAGHSIRRLGMIEARFVPRSSSADAAILSYLRACKDPGNYIVVTSDQAVDARARQAGARVISADAFLRAAAASQDRARKEKPPEDPEEIDEWLRLFGA